MTLEDAEEIAVHAAGAYRRATTDARRSRSHRALAALAAADAALDQALATVADLRAARERDADRAARRARFARLNDATLAQPRLI